MMYQKCLVEPFVSVQRRRKPIGLNVELENLSLTRKVQAAFESESYQRVNTGFVSVDQIGRLLGRERATNLH